jgi:hypothetical protein
MFSHQDLLRTCLWRKSWLVLVLLGSTLIYPHLLGDGPERGLRIKASYVFNFLRYTTWKEDAGGVIKVAVIGSREFLEPLKKMEKERVWDRPIQVHSLEKIEDLPENCHVLVVVDEETEIDFHAIPKGVLTVTDQRFGIKNGAMIRFFKEGDRVLFKVDYRRVLKADIKMSSRLLRVAKLVK